VRLSAQTLGGAFVPDCKLQFVLMLLLSWATACAGTEPPTCGDSDLYVPIVRYHPEGSSQPGWVSVGLEVAPSGYVNRTFVIAEDASSNFTSAALRAVKRWRYCKLRDSDMRLRSTYACVYSATTDLDLAQLSSTCAKASPTEVGVLQ